jgi:hypothetical protein
MFAKELDHIRLFKYNVRNCMESKLHGSCAAEAGCARSLGGHQMTSTWFQLPVRGYRLSSIGLNDFISMVSTYI